jgi:hypothetical protein
MQRLLFLSLLLAFFSAAAHADGIETITASNVAIGQDTLYFQIQLDTTTSTVVAGSVDFGVSNAELPWYLVTDSNGTLQWKLFDSLDYGFGGVQTDGSWIAINWNENSPALAGISAYCSDANCSGSAPGFSTATAGTIAVNGAPVATPEPSPIALVLFGLLIFFTGLLIAKRR